MNDNQFSSSERQVPLNRQGTPPQLSKQFNSQQSQPPRPAPISIPPVVTDQSQPIKKAKVGMEKVAYYIFLATAFLVPIVFIPSPYLALDVAKTFMIVIGTLAVAICYGIVAFKERKLILPPKAILWTSVFLAVSLIVSSFTSIHLGKSFFGQGFEIGTTSLILALFLSALVAFEVIRRDQNRVRKLYAVLGIAFTILVVVHGLRLAFGPSFLSLSILGSATSTLLGKWNGLAILSILTTIISASALRALRPKGRAKIFYMVLGFVGLLLAFLVNQTVAWIAATAIFASLTAVLWRSDKSKADPEIGRLKSYASRTPWLMVVLTLIALIFVWKGTILAKPLIDATNTQYAELSLPWQMTIDVVGGAVKNYPWFGVGPNHFTQAFMVYKPLGFNLSNAWNVEFGSGFGFIPTLFATQGGVGIILWILFFVFLGIGSTRLLKRLPEDSEKKFIAISSFGAMVFLWIVSILYAPSHAVLFLAFVMTGVFVAATVSNNSAAVFEIAPTGKKTRGIVMPVSLIILISIAVAWGLVQIKKTVALAYFAGGVKSINVSGEFAAADAAFKKAVSVDESDVYWQALAENSRLEVNQIVTTATSSSPEIATKLANMINAGVEAARKAIAYNPANYYNFVAEARVSALAAQLKMANAYDNAVRAYTDAIRLNPSNPSLYVNLAQVQAAEGKLDEALQSIGFALQVKNNYLDAVYLLSQVQAAKGDLKNAIISAQVATEINPQNPLLFFHLGLLEYNAQTYDTAAQAFAKAVELEPNYANAHYFLGLSATRLNDSALAIAQFEELAKTNPDNQEVLLILGNLRAGKSPFANATPPVTPTPEKRKSLPVEEN